MSALTVACVQHACTDDPAANLSASAAGIRLLRGERFDERRFLRIRKRAAPGGEGERAILGAGETGQTGDRRTGGRCEKETASIHELSPYPDCWLRG